MPMLLVPKAYTQKARGEIEVYGYNSEEENYTFLKNESEGDLFSSLVGNSNILIDPVADFSRSFGLSIKGGLPGQQKLFVDGHDMEDVTSLQRNPRFDIAIYSAMDSITLDYSPKFSFMGQGSSSGVISSISSKKNYLSLRSQGNYGGSFIYQKIAPNFLGRISAQYLNLPSVFPDGQEKDLKRGIDLRLARKFKIGEFKLLFLQSAQNYDDLNADSLFNNSEFNKVSLIYKKNWWGNNFSSRHDLNLNVQKTNRKEFISSENYYYRGMSAGVDYKIRLNTEDYFFKLKLDRVDKLENASLPVKEMIFFDGGYQKDLGKDSVLDSFGIRYSIGRSGENIIFSDIKKTWKKIGLSVNSGGRFASFYERFSPFGNPNLKTQKNYGIDLYYTHKNFKLNLFKKNTHNFIDYDFNSSRYENLKVIDSIGLNVNFYPLEKLTSSFLISRVSDKNTGIRLPGRSELVFTNSYEFYSNIKLNYRGLFSRVGLEDKNLENLHYVDMNYLYKLNKEEFVLLNLKNILNEKSSSLFPANGGGVNFIAEYVRGL